MRLTNLALCCAVALTWGERVWAVDYLTDTTLTNQQISETNMTIAYGNGLAAVMNANNTTFILTRDVDIGGLGGSGLLNLNQSTLTLGDALSLGNAGGFPLTRASSGVLNVGSGSVVNAPFITIGQGTAFGAGGSGVMNIAQGGTVNLLTSSGLLAIGIDGATGTLNIDGTLNLMTLGLVLGSELNSGDGTGTAIVNINQGGVFATNARMILSEASTQFNLNGGTLLINPVDLSVPAPGFPDHTVFTFALQTTAASTIEVANGALFESTGGISGAGSITKTGSGEMLLAGTNSWQGGTIIADGVLQAQNSGALPEATAYTINGGTLDLNGYPLTMSSLAGSGGILQLGSANALTVDQASDTQFAGQISGTGSLTKTGSGTLVLSGNSATYAGPIDVNAGGVEVNGDLSAAALSVASDATLSGTGQVGETTLASGSQLIVGQRADTSAKAVNFTTGSLSNGGLITVNRNGAATGSTLTVNGDYTSSGGRLILGSSLGNDASSTARLLISGNASGATDVQVTNLGGKGDATINGIEVVQVGGTSQPGAFYNSQNISAGLYNYSVVQRGQNFYLTSDYVGSGSSANPGGAKNIRAVAGGYIANLAAANTLFALRLADREGSTEYRDPVTGQPGVTSLWLRQAGGHTAFHSDSLRTSANRYVAQLGGELAHGSFTGSDRWNLGLMAGYANQQGNTRASLSGNRADSRIHGYSTGLYATWYQNAAQRMGLYLDSWAQYNGFRNRVSEPGQPQDRYDSQGLTASVESGYTFNVYPSQRTAAYLQPQAQLVWMGVNADDHRDNTGTRVQGEGDNNLQTRLGLRAFLKGHSAADDTTGRSFQPYVEANWIHNTQRYAVRMDGDSLSQQGARNIGEVKTGIEGQLTAALNVWGGVGVSLGDKGYNDTYGQLGLKYRF